jgi:hypothetical protein
MSSTVETGPALPDKTPGPAVQGASPGPPVVPDFAIVPRVGVAIAGTILVLLVVSIAGNWLWPLDFFHVAGGGLWTGIDLFVGLAVGPIIARMSVPARVEFSVRFMPKMLVIMPTLVIVTLAAGYQLARHLGNLAPGAPLHGWIVASYVVVGVMTVIALGLLEPANLAVLFELKKERPDGERIGRLMRIFVYTAGITGAMQVATLVIMSKLAAG